MYFYQATHIFLKPLSADKLSEIKEKCINFSFKIKDITFRPMFLDENKLVYIGKNPNDKVLDESQLKAFKKSITHNILREEKNNLNIKNGFVFGESSKLSKTNADIPKSDTFSVEIINFASYAKIREQSNIYQLVYPMSNDIPELEEDIAVLLLKNTELACQQFANKNKGNMLSTYLSMAKVEKELPISKNSNLSGNRTATSTTKYMFNRIKEAGYCNDNEGNYLFYKWEHPPVMFRENDRQLSLYRSLSLAECLSFAVDKVEPKKSIQTLAEEIEKIEKSENALFEKGEYDKTLIGFISLPTIIANYNDFDESKFREYFYNIIRNYHTIVVDCPMGAMLHFSILFGVPKIKHIIDIMNDIIASCNRDEKSKPIAMALIYATYNLSAILGNGGDFVYGLDFLTKNYKTFSEKRIKSSVEEMSKLHEFLKEYREMLVFERMTEPEQLSNIFRSFDKYKEISATLNSTDRIVAGLDRIANARNINDSNTDIIQGKLGQIENPREALESLIGLSTVKELLNDIVNKTAYQNFFSGAKVVKEDKSDKNVTYHDSMHMAFMGNPGTAKTTVAKLLAEILYSEKIIANPVFVEMPASSLIAKWVGHTGPKVREAFEKAKGGVLFIDEAYALVEDYGRNNFKAEAVATIVDEMEKCKNDTIVILAGYIKPMKELLQSNQGLSSRVTYKVEFPDYSEDDLANIFLKIAKENSFLIEEKSVETIKNIVKKLATTEKNTVKSLNKWDDNAEVFANGRFIRNLFENVKTTLANRVMKDRRQMVHDLPSTIEYINWGRTIIADDLEALQTKGYLKPVEVKDNRIPFGFTTKAQKTK